MKKKSQPAVVREIRQTGLKLYEVQTINPNAPGGMDALKAMFCAATPEARLARVKERAKQYADVADVQREIQTIEGVWKDTRFTFAISYMLLAIERGLDLLDTGRYLPALKRERRFSEKRGAKEVSAKNKYIAGVAKQFAGQRDRNKQTALFVWETAPKTDDGESHFYWIGMKFFDRDEPDKPLTFARLKFRVQKACSVPAKKKVGEPS
jgi:hypothetical protein